MKPLRKSEFGKPLVNSCFTFSLLIGVSVHDTTLGTLVANLGYDKMHLPCAGLRGRYVALRKRVHRAPRKQVAAERGNRHLGSPRIQPARRAGVRVHAHRAAAEKAAMTEPRSWLFVPADSERKIAKALDSDADAVIFDLEDSVAPRAEGRRAGDPRRAAQAVRRSGVVGSRQPARHRVPQGRSRADRRRRYPRHRPAQGRKRRRRGPALRIAPAIFPSTRSSPRPPRACSAYSPIAIQSRCSPP